MCVFLVELEISCAKQTLNSRPLHIMSFLNYQQSSMNDLCSCPDNSDRCETLKKSPLSIFLFLSKKQSAPGQFWKLKTKQKAINYSLVVLEKIICSSFGRRKLYLLRVREQLPCVIFAVVSEGTKGQYKLFLVFLCMSA